MTFHRKNERAEPARASGVAPSRRSVLTGGLLLGGGLLFGIRLPTVARAAQQGADQRGQLPEAAPFAPDAFIRIGAEGPVRLIMRNTEVGQGIYTSTAMLIAEELEVGMDQILAEPAPPNDPLYKNALLGQQATGGSASTRVDWQDMRQAGATARTMLVQAAANRWGVEPATCQASRAAVTHPPSGRSATYNELAEEAGRLPVPQNVPLKPPTAFKLIGTPQHRLDTPAKVNGSAVFGIDVKIDGMRVGTVAACPVLGGKLRGFDEAAARRVPGVRDVVRTEDALAVIGDHYWAAKSGLEAAAPVWDYGSNAGVAMDRIIQSLDQASQKAGAVAKAEGDPETAIKGAAKQLSAIYQLPFLSHAPMEPINTTIHVRPDGADVWVGTQVPTRVQDAVAKVTGLPLDSIVVHNQYMGGAFGRRLDVDSIFQAAAVAKQLSYPVKLIWSREEDIQHDLYRPYYYDRLSAGLDAQGRIVGWVHKTTGSSVMGRWAPQGMKQDGKLDPDAVEGAEDPVYDIPVRHVEYVRAETPGVTTLWWRGVGPTHNFFVVEGFIDELAAAAGKDPLEFRRSLLTKDQRALKVLNTAAEKAGWGTPLPANTGRGIALQYAFNTYMATVLQVSVSPRGEVRLLKADVAVDCGPVVNPDTVVAQVQGGLIFGLSTAMYNEITLKDGRVEQSNFHDYRVLRIDEAPRVDVHIVPDPNATLGGIGETGTVAAAPALVNAIHAASGRRLRSVPVATGKLAAS